MKDAVETLGDKGTRDLVLVVDDIETNRELLRQDLEEEGFAVATAASGAECLVAAKRLSPSVIILDIMMPGMDGIETCKHLKESPATAHIPVLFVTGRDDSDQTVVDALGAGGNDFLQKPYSLPVLVARVTSQVSIFRAHQELRRLAMTDALTGLYSRHFLYHTTRQMLKQLSRKAQPMVSCAMVDIDHFKRVNDELGHLAGDDVLKQIGAAIRRSTRESDTVARFGGEEFAVIMPATDLEGAAIVAEKIRSTVEDLFGKAAPPVTASVGVACVQDAESTADRKSTDWQEVMINLFRCADAALYRAKNSGRNRVCREQNTRCGTIEGATPEERAFLNRRQHRRLGVAIEVDLVDQRGRKSVQTADLSAGGLALQGHLGLKEGHEVTLCLHLEEERLDVRGVVVWCGLIPGLGMRYGVAFDALDPDSLHRLQAFLSERVSRL